MNDDALTPPGELPPAPPGADGDASTPGAPPPGSGGSERRAMHRRLTVNSASNLMRYVVSLGVAFFLTPFVVKTLGDSAYGFWVVVLSFVGYAGILELGVQPAVIKVVGQHKGSGDWRKLGELLSAAFLFFLGVGLLAGIAIAVAGPVIIHHLVKSFSLGDRVHLIFLLIALDVILVFMNYFFTAILYGWQLYPVKNFIDIAGWLVNAGIVVAFLSRGGLLLIAASKAATDTVVLAATLAACRRHLPHLRPALRGHTRNSFRELFSYGGKLFISATSSRVASYTQPVIISSRLSAAATTFFAIPARLVEYSREIVFALSSGFMPMFSELAGREDRATIRDVYRAYSRYILLVVFPILVVILVYGKAFIGLWVGPRYAAEGGRVLQLLTIDAAILGIQPLFWRLFMGVGRLNLLVATSSVASLAKVGLGFILVGRLGIEGVAYGFLAITIPSQLIYLVYTSRYLEQSPARLFLETTAGPLAVAAAYYAVLRGIAAFLGQDSYWVMLAGAALSLIAYLPLIAAALTRDERRVLAAATRARMPAAVRRP